MEVQSKPGPNGTPATFPSPNPGAAVPPADPTRMVGIILRGFAIVLVLIATILMGVAKQTKDFDTADVLGNPVTVTVTVKSTDSSAFVYFIAANATVFFFSTISFALSIINRSSVANMSLLSLVDLVTVALLFSCNGAAAAITIVAEKGTSNFAWFKFCDVTGEFCSEVTGALVLSMIASLAYFLLLLISILGFHKRSQPTY